MLALHPRGTLRPPCLLPGAYLAAPDLGSCAVLAQGGDPLEPPLACGPVPSSPGRCPAGPGGRPPATPAGLRPGSFVTGALPCWPRGATPWNPRWPAARFLRHRAVALLAQGGDPLEPPLACGPVPSSPGRCPAGPGG